MRTLVYKLHKLFNTQPRLFFPFNTTSIPKNGIYIIFEKGERFDGLDRIVRVGTHTGDNQLISRLKQHFYQENKNRSIFRKNIGRCILAKENPSYLPIWELDITPKIDREKKLSQIDKIYEKQLETRISQYIRNNFSFCVFEVAEKSERLFWESRLVSILAQSTALTPSIDWLGNYSTKDKIRESGLWQVNELNNQPLNDTEFSRLIQILSSVHR